MSGAVCVILQVKKRALYCTSSAIWSARVWRSASSLRMSDSSAMATVELWRQARKTVREKEREAERD